MKPRAARAGPAAVPAWYLRLGPFSRVAIAAAIGVLAAFASMPLWPLPVRILAAWDAAAASYLALAWLAIVHADSKVTRENNETQDPSRYLLFLLVVGAAIASVGAIGIVRTGAHDLPRWTQIWHLSLSMLALLLSWLLIQTLFGFHYAHRYYGGHDETRLQRHGVEFPADRDPDYLDFAYYSFVVGMTSQVSDVVITTRPMRRLTLIHGVLSFLFNLAILSMSINVVGDALR